MAGAYASDTQVLSLDFSVNWRRVQAAVSAGGRL